MTTSSAGAPVATGKSATGLFVAGSAELAAVRTAWAGVHAK
ncbi:hypothetical protein [Streptomyces sp. ALB3]